MPEHVLTPGVEIISDGGWRRWTAAEKLRIVEGEAEPNLDERANISVAARRDGVGADLPYRWRRLMLEGRRRCPGRRCRHQQPRGAADGVSASARSSASLDAGPWMSDPEGSLGEGTPRRTDVAGAVAAQGRFPVSVVAQTIGVSRSRLHARLAGPAEPRRRCHKAQDAVVVAPLITTLVAARPTCGCRRITALLNRQFRSDGAAPVNHKRVFRTLQAHGLLLARRHAVRSDHAHDGTVVTLRSNLRSPSGSDRWRP